MNHLTTEIWYTSGGTATETLTYSFDANGNELTARNSSGAYTMTYDAMNRVTVVQDMWGDTLTFSYDLAGNRTKVQDSQGGVTTSVYDADNNLVTQLFGGSGLTPLRIDETYNEDNQAATITRYSDLAGTTTVSYSAYSYDTVNRLTNLITKKGSDNSVLSNFTYTYDPGSRLKTEVDNGTTVTYAYDTTNQLTADGSSTFTFDGAGNRNNGSYGVTTGNEITTDGVWTYTFDAEGNLTKKSKGASLETWTYGYDNKNELTSAEDRATDGGTLLQKVTYKYDPMGDRIESAVDNNGDSVVDSTTRFAYDGWKTGAMPPSGFIGNENFDIWADLDGQNSNALQTRYVRGSAIDQVFARIGASGSAYWLLTDRQGSIRDVQDNSTLAIKDTLTYDGWGNIASETDNTFRGRYAYTSRELDTETGLQYNRARYYDARTGRWISQDPLGFEAGDSNLYRYVRNSPPQYLDARGTQAVPVETLKNPEFEVDNRKLLVTVQKNLRYQGENWIKLSVTANRDDKRDMEDYEWIQFGYRFRMKRVKGKDVFASNVYDNSNTGLKEKFMPYESSEQWLDTYDLKSPYYSRTGETHRSTIELSILDAPTIDEREGYIKTGTVFDSYLIYDKKTLYHVHWERITQVGKNKTEYTNISGERLWYTPSWVYSKKLLAGYKDQKLTDKKELDNPVYRPEPVRHPVPGAYPGLRWRQLNSGDPILHIGV